MVIKGMDSKPYRTSELGFQRPVGWTTIPLPKPSLGTRYSASGERGHTSGRERSTEYMARLVELRGMVALFADRTEAGEELAALLDAHDVVADLVLAVPRGGLPVGRVVADRLGVPLDVVVARKVGAPQNPELALGAVAADGSVWSNDDLVSSGGMSPEYLEDAIEREREAAQETVRRYRGTDSPPDLAGKRIVVVDDGVATGATAFACLRQVRRAGAAHVTFAAPVGPPRTIERLRTEADAVVCVATPPSFSAVSAFYDNFEQVPDERAMASLEE